MCPSYFFSKTYFLLTCDLVSFASKTIKCIKATEVVSKPCNEKIDKWNKKFCKYLKNNRQFGIKASTNKVSDERAVAKLRLNIKKKLETYNFWEVYLAHIPHRQRELGNLVLRHSDPIKILPFPSFRRTLEALLVEWWKWTPSFASTSERR